MRERGSLMTQVLFEVVGVSKYFGSLAAPREVSFSVQSAEIVSLIGPNGASKTTLVNVLSGAARPSAGDIRYRGRWASQTASSCSTTERRSPKDRRIRCL